MEYEKMKFGVWSSDVVYLDGLTRLVPLIKVISSFSRACYFL